MKCDLLFPTPIFIFDYNDLNEENIKIVNYYNLILANKEGVNKTNIGGYQSESNLFLLPVTKTLVKKLFESIEVIKTNLKINNKLQIDGGWLNVNKKGDYNVHHIHPRSLFSGVYYVKCTPDSGDIIFHTPLTAKEMTDPDYNECNNITANANGYIPKEGRCLFFPSWLTHSVKPNMSDNARFSISFNVFFND